MADHELKCWPSYFRALWCHDKTFEVRLNDRGFAERDHIIIREFEGTEGGVDGHYTGRKIEGIITYVTNFGCQEGHVVFSFREAPVDWATAKFFMMGIALGVIGSIVAYIIQILLRFTK